MIGQAMTVSFGGKEYEARMLHVETVQRDESWVKFRFRALPEDFTVTMYGSLRRQSKGWRRHVRRMKAKGSKRR